jgi:hypothetical protein
MNPEAPAKLAGHVKDDKGSPRRPVIPLGAQGNLRNLQPCAIDRRHIARRGARSLHALPSSLKRATIGVRLPCRLTASWFTLASSAAMPGAFLIVLAVGLAILFPALAHFGRVLVGVQPEAASRLGFLCEEHGFEGPEAVPDETGVYPLLRRVRYKRSGTPGEIAAQVGVGVVSGGALEPGEIGGHCEPQPISMRDQGAGLGRGLTRCSASCFNTAPAGQPCKPAGAQRGMSVWPVRHGRPVRRSARRGGTVGLCASLLASAALTSPEEEQHQHHENH